MRWQSLKLYCNDCNQYLLPSFHHVSYAILTINMTIRELFHIEIRGMRSKLLPTTIYCSEVHRQWFMSSREIIFDDLCSTILQNLDVIQKKARSDTSDPNPLPFRLPYFNGQPEVLVDALCRKRKSRYHIVTCDNDSDFRFADISEVEVLVWLMPNPKSPRTCATDAIVTSDT